MTANPRDMGEGDARTAEGSDERATGTPNTIYDLSRVLFHALKDGALYDAYIRDADKVGDRELADFFGRVRDEDSMRADEARWLLAERTPTTERVVGETAPSAGGMAGGAPFMTELDEISSRTETAPISEPGKREPDVPPVRPEKPPPPGTGVGGR
jgi:hypothetical protein